MLDGATEGHQHPPRSFRFGGSTDGRTDDEGFARISSGNKDRTDGDAGCRRGGVRRATTDFRSGGVDERPGRAPTRKDPQGGPKYKKKLMDSFWLRVDAF